MEKMSSSNKQTVYVAILVALLTYFISSFASGWNRVDDILTRDEVQEIVVDNGEDVLNRSRQYTDDRVDGISITYQVHIENIEKIIKAQNDKFEAILESINGRLDRIDKRNKN